MMEIHNEKIPFLPDGEKESAVPSFNHAISKVYECDKDKFVALCKLAETLHGVEKTMAFNNLYKQVFKDSDIPITCRHGSTPMGYSKK